MAEPQNLSIHDLPEEERPRERLLTHGAEHLSNAELIAILLRVGNSQENAIQLATRLLATFNGLGGLVRLRADELRQIKGMGDAKISQLLAALELGKRLVKLRAEAKPIIRSAADAANLLMDMAHLTQEQIRVMLLDTSRQVLAIQTVYMGTVNMSVVRSAEIFREAIIRNSTALIMAHNHPSGNPNPSPEDVELTRHLIAAGKLLDIQLVDHLIIGANEWRSLREMGLAFGG